MAIFFKKIKESIRLKRESDIEDTFSGLVH